VEDGLICVCISRIEREGCFIGVWESEVYSIIIFKSFYEHGSVQIGVQEGLGHLFRSLHGPVDQEQQVCGHQVHEEKI